MSFEECCTECIGNDELVQQFNRLTNHSIGVHRTPVQIVIDNACNYDPDKEAFHDFCQFVYGFVWMPLISKIKENDYV
jgi:hypothetical protein